MTEKKTFIIKTLDGATLVFDERMDRDKEMQIDTTDGLSALTFWISRDNAIDLISYLQHVFNIEE